jgi:hypothetical protein
MSSNSLPRARILLAQRLASFAYLVLNLVLVIPEGAVSTAAQLEIPPYILQVDFIC